MEVYLTFMFHWIITLENLEGLRTSNILVCYWDGITFNLTTSLLIDVVFVHAVTKVKQRLKAKSTKEKD